MASALKLTDFKALVFDVYGTLCDWETGMYEALLPTLKRAENDWDRKKALGFISAAENRLQSENPKMIYTDILANAHKDLCETLKKTTPSLSYSNEDHVAFGQSIKDWPLFPDTSDALAYLSTQFKLVVLSNVDRESFAYTQTKLEAGKFTFDEICTAQDIGSYKPDPANFLYALRVLKENHGINKEHVLATAWSLHHDHAPAQGLGVRSAWIEREGSVMELGDSREIKYNFSYKTMGDMAEAVRKEARDR